MAPVVRALQAAKDIQLEVALTAQHREILDQALDLFGIRADVDLDVMEERQTLPQLSSRLLAALDGWLTKSQPDLVLVQGDTTTVFVTALAAFYRGVPVGHVEAGLRTPVALNPFPEEMNRRLVSRLALLHFAPTDHARDTLLREGADANLVFRTGNTVVDALQAIRSTNDFADVAIPVGLQRDEALVLVTMHRRESWDRIDQVCGAISDVLATRPHVKVLFPVHPNPAVREPIYRLLGHVPRVHLVDPMSYLPFVKAMAVSRVILTDSGGVQEEAPVLGRPVLVLRDATERPEAIDAGVARLVGTDRAAIVMELSRLVDDADACARMSKAVSPFGDGHAAEYIARIIGEHRDLIASYAQRTGNPRKLTVASTS